MHESPRAEGDSPSLQVEQKPIDEQLAQLAIRQNSMHVAPLSIS